MPQLKMKDVIDEAASLLNDFGLSSWTKERLIQHGFQAHRQLQVKLALNGIPVLKEVSAVITVLVGATDLGENQPSDLIEPKSLWERKAGSSDTFVLMQEKGWEPEQVQSSTLNYWNWRGERIKFLGATTNREVKIKYLGGIEVPTQEEDYLGFLFAENYLIPETAAIAAGSLGNKETYQIMNAIAEKNLEEVIAFNIKGQQALPVRRRPYRSSRRLRRF